MNEPNYGNKDYTYKIQNGDDSLHNYDKVIYKNNLWVYLLWQKLNGGLAKWVSLISYSWIYD